MQPAAAADDGLWREICAMRDATPPADRHGAARFDWEIANSRQLLQRLRSYETLFPGGARRDEAVALEFQTQFDLISLGGAEWDDLCSRVATLRRAAPSPAILHEAAYWQMFCDRQAHKHATSSAPATAAASAPASQAARRAVTPAQSGPATALVAKDSVLTPDDELLAAYRRYCDAFPTSRYVPRLSVQLFEDAQRDGDTPAMRAISERLAANFPDHPFAAQLAGALRRSDAVGRPFWVSFRRVGDGATVDTRTMSGKPVLIVVWAGFDAGARRLVAEVEAFRAQRPEWQIVGINIDATAADCQRSAAHAAIGWPQSNDGRGWGTQFLLDWGIRDAAFVLCIDREGRLRGSAAGAAWRKLVDPIAGGAPRSPTSDTTDIRR